MVAIRLARTGAKKKPSYRVVVMDKRRARDSRNIEIVGHYNPRPDPIELVLKRDRIDYWLGVGAQPSDTVKRLLRHFDKHGSSVAVAGRETQMQTEPAPMQTEPAPIQTAVPEAETPSSLETEVPVDEAVVESPGAIEQTPAVLEEAAVQQDEQPVEPPTEAGDSGPSPAPAPADAPEPASSGVQAEEDAKE